MKGVEFYNGMINQIIPRMVGIDDFAMKHFAKGESSTQIGMDPDAFLHLLIEHFEKHPVGICKRVPNMPFCIYIKLENFTQAKDSIVEITNDNYLYIRTEYVRRWEKELPVLMRWIDLPIGPKKSKYLYLILYSAEQIRSEALAKDPLSDVQKYESADWFIISIISSSNEDMPPMPPITMMRNALGKEEGGNGVPIDRESYEESVRFWEKNISIK